MRDPRTGQGAGSITGLARVDRGSRPVGVRGEGGDGSRPRKAVVVALDDGPLPVRVLAEQFLAREVGDHGRGGKLVPPGMDLPRPPLSKHEFELSLRRQLHLRPPAVSHGVVPGDQGHGMRRRCSRQLTPVGDRAPVHTGPATSVRMHTHVEALAGPLRIRLVARFLREVREAASRDFALVHVEGPNDNLMAGLLVFQSDRVPRNRPIRKRPPGTRIMAAPSFRRRILLGYPLAGSFPVPIGPAHPLM